MSLTTIVLATMLNATNPMTQNLPEPNKEKNYTLHEYAVKEEELHVPKACYSGENWQYKNRNGNDYDSMQMRKSHRPQTQHK